MDSDEFEGLRTMERRYNAGRYGWHPFRDYYTDYINQVLKDLSDKEHEAWQRLGASSSEANRELIEDGRKPFPVLPALPLMPISWIPEFQESE